MIDPNPNVIQQCDTYQLLRINQIDKTMAKKNFFTHTRTNETKRNETKHDVGASMLMIQMMCV